MIAPIFRRHCTALWLLVLLLSGCGGAMPPAAPGAAPTQLHQAPPTPGGSSATAQLPPMAPTSEHTMMTRIPTSTKTMPASASIIPTAGLYESHQEASYLTLEVTHTTNQVQVRLLRGQWAASCGHDYYLRLSPWPQAVPITQGVFQHQYFTGQVLAGDQIAITGVIKNSACGNIEIKAIASLKKTDK